MKPKLVLLSGTLGTQKLWQHQIDNLSELAEIIVPDLSQHNTMTHLAEHLLNKLPDTFAVAGFSMGGIIAQELLKHAPERVSKLALISTSTGKPDNTKLERFESWQSATPETFEAIVNALPTWVHADHTQVQPVIKRMALDLGLDVFKKQAGILLSQDNSDENILKNYQGSSLILHGEDDPVSSVAGHKVLEELLVNSKRIMFQTCGHYVPLEKASKATEALAHWIKD